MYQHLALLAAARAVGLGEFEQFDGRAVFEVLMMGWYGSLLLGVNLSLQ